MNGGEDLNANNRESVGLYGDGSIPDQLWLWISDQRKQ